MALAATAGYTADDLDWLRTELGVAHIELDPWGSPVVTPASDPHEFALELLADQARRQLGRPAGRVYVNGLSWKIPGGSGYLNVPDLLVLPAGWTREGELHLAPAPWLVVEVGSRSTRAVDHGRKLADYRLGGAGVYLIVDLGDPVGFEAHVFAADTITIATRAIDLTVAGQPVRFELDGDYS